MGDDDAVAVVGGQKLVDPVGKIEKILFGYHRAGLEKDLLGRHLGQLRKLGYLGDKIVDRDDRRGIALGRDAALGLGCDGAAGGHQVYFLQAAIVRFHFRDALLSSVGEVV